MATVRATSAKNAKETGKYSSNIRKDLETWSAGVSGFGTKFNEDGQVQLMRVGKDTRPLSPDDYKKVLTTLGEVQRIYGELRKRGLNESRAVAEAKAIWEKRSKAPSTAPPPPPAAGTSSGSSTLGSFVPTNVPR